MDNHNRWMGAVGKGKGDGKKGDGKKVDGKGGKNNVAGKGKGQGTQKFDGNCNFCKKYGHMARDCCKKKRTTHRSRRTWVPSTSPLFSRLHRRRVLVLWLW